MRCNGTWSKGDVLLSSLRDHGKEIRPNLHQTRYRATIRLGESRVVPVAGGGMLVRCEGFQRAAGVI